MIKKKPHKLLPIEFIQVSDYGLADGVSEVYNKECRGKKDHYFGNIIEHPNYFCNIFLVHIDNVTEETIKQVRKYIRHFEYITLFDYQPFAPANLRVIDKEYIAKTLPAISIEVEKNITQLSIENRVKIAVTAAFCIRELHHNQKLFYHMKLSDIYLHKKNENDEINSDAFLVELKENDQYSSYYVFIDNVGFKYDPNFSEKDDIENLGIIFKLLFEGKDLSFDIKQLCDRMTSEEKIKRPSIDFVWYVLTKNFSDITNQLITKEFKEKISVKEKSGLYYLLNPNIAERSLTTGLIMLATPKERQMGTAEAKFFVDFILSNKYFKFENKWFVTNGLEEKIDEITRAEQPNYDQEYVDAIAIWNVIIPITSEKLKDAINNLVVNKSILTKFISEKEILKMEKRHCKEKSFDDDDDDEMFVDFAPLKSIVDLDLLSRIFYPKFKNYYI